MTKDRDYYRNLPTSELIVEVRYGINIDWRELAIALAERLEDEERDRDYDEY